MHYISANWPAPKTIQALTTTRLCNLDELVMPGEPIKLKQIHSSRCIRPEADLEREADAAVTSTPNLPLMIRTADCLPIVLCNTMGTEIAAIHAGWRGLCQGVIESTLEKMHSRPEQMLAWIGPGICQRCFEVGAEVRNEFIAYLADSEPAFYPHPNLSQKWFANLPEIASNVLKKLGVCNIYHSKKCTFEQEDIFFSYRRAKDSGRMNTIIWFNQ